MFQLGQYKRTSDDIVDEFGLLDTLHSAHSKFLFNPGHDYMVRPEMPKKRAVLSQGGRWLFAVWNRGNKKKGAPERRQPWQVFYDGRDATTHVDELDHDLGPDVRIGVIDTAAD